MSNRPAEVVAAGLNELLSLLRPIIMSGKAQTPS